ncbi:MAG: class I SAM-dependent methyltransferase [Candidatus Saccharibacteria bacterium]
MADKSRTAIITACYRAFHALNDEPKIFDDSLALQLVSADEYKTFQAQMVGGFRASAPDYAASFPNDGAIMSFMMRAMATPALIFGRSRYAEDRLKEAVQTGIQQYIILGAGLDSFAFRNLESLAYLKVFELDLPGTQDYKRKRLNELGWECPANLHFIEADFTKESVSELLARSRYDSSVPSFFNWLGVTYYLPRETVFATLQSIASIAAPGSMVVFDYLDQDILDPEKSAPRSQQILMLAEQVGEPIQALFDPASLAQDLSRLGLRLAENLSPAEIQARYFADRSDGYYACENAHLACAVVECTF